MMSEAPAAQSQQSQDSNEGFLLIDERASKEGAEDIQTGQTEGAGTLQTHGPKYKDIQTGLWIPAKRFAEINAAIVELLCDIQEGNKAWMETLKQGGSILQAQEASTAAAGGRFFKLYDNLCQENILVSMQVKLPPAKHMSEVHL